MKFSMRVVLVERDERKAKKMSGRVKTPSSPRLRALDHAWDFTGGKRTPSFIEYHESHKLSKTVDIQDKKESVDRIVEQTPHTANDVEDFDEVYFHDEDLDFGPAFYGRGF